MTKTPEKKATTILTAEVLAETSGGHHRGRGRGRTPVFMTEAQKLGGRTKYFTNGDRLFYGRKRLGRMDEIL